LVRRDNPIALTWSSTLKSAPFTSGPLLYDLDGDSYNDIVAANVAGEVWAIHGETGHVIDGWPFFVENKSFHTTPLLVSECVLCSVCNYVCVCVCLCVCVVCVLVLYGGTIS